MGGKSFGSILGWLLAAVAVSAVGVAIITRVPPVRRLVFNESAS